MSQLTIELDNLTETRLKQLQTKQETVNQVAARILADSVAQISLKSPDEMADEELLAYLEAESGKVVVPEGEKIRPEQTTFVVGTEMRSDMIRRG